MLKHLHQDLQSQRAGSDKWREKKKRKTLQEREQTYILAWKILESLVNELIEFKNKEVGKFNRWGQYSLRGFSTQVERA